MRRCLLFLLLLAYPALAGQVMVLATQGTGRAIVDGTAVPLRTGLILQPADRLELKVGARATLLLIPEGQRQEAIGASVVTVTETGLKNQGGSLTPVAGPAVSLVPSGKNMRHMAGQALRAGVTMLDSPVRALRVDGNRLSWRSDAGGTLTAAVYRQADQYWFADVEGEPSLRVWTGDEVKPEALTTVNVTGVRQGDSWLYSTELKLPEPGSYGLKLQDASRDLLSTRIWVGEAPQLTASLQEAAEWAEREPDSPQPYLFKMALLDDYDRLDEALQAGLAALERSPDDPGLYEQLARLSLAAGRYTQAVDYWKRAYRQSPSSTKGAQ